MSTQTILLARIADDIARSDLTTQIREAIGTAIDYFQSDRFYFTETRASTFVTVAAQSRYVTADDADIPRFVKLDRVFLEDSGSVRYMLERISPVEMEAKLDTSAASGRPTDYAYFDSAFWLYPIPDAVYTVRPMGVIKIAAPATDGEASNPWMTDAFELIRCSAKLYLAGHVVIDPELLSIARAGEQRALDRLRAETSRKVASGRISPTVF